MSVPYPDHMDWRTPTEEAFRRVAQVAKERTAWQHLIRQRRDFQSDATTWDRLTVSQQRGYADRFDALDAAILRDKTLLYFPFDKQVEFHSGKYLSSPDAPMGKAIKAKTRMAVCGNRAGKTVPGTVEAVWWAQGNHPFIFTPPPPVTVWVVAINYDQSEDINKPMVEEYLPTGYKWNGKLRRWTLPNGSEIRLKSQESKRTNFQGKGVSLVLWDEEGVDLDESKKVYGECEVRTWDCAGQIVMTLTPIEGFKWIRDLAQKGLGGDTEIDVYQWSTLDNPYIPHDAVSTTKYDSEDERQVRLYGSLIPLGIRCMFHKPTLQEWLRVTQDTPFRWGKIEKEVDGAGIWQLVGIHDADEPTAVKIFKDPDPKEFYIAAADTGGGVGENYSALTIFATKSREVVCTYRSNVTAIPEFANNCMMLGKQYRCGEIDRSALLCPEQNMHGHAMIQELLRQRYDHLWYAPKKIGVGYEDFPGWRTDVATKPMFESALHVAIEERNIIINDPRFVEELLTYQIHPGTQKTGAQKGEHDDCVISLAIALAVADMQPRKVSQMEPRENRISEMPLPKQLRIAATQAQWKRERRAW